MIVFRPVLRRVRNISDRSCRENQPHILHSITFFLRRSVEKYYTGRLLMTIWRMRIAYCLPKATVTHSEYLIRIAFPWQQKSHERASMWRFTYIVCLVKQWYDDCGEVKIILHYKVLVKTYIPHSYWEFFSMNACGSLVTAKHVFDRVAGAREKRRKFP